MATVTSTSIDPLREPTAAACPECASGVVAAKAVALNEIVVCQECGAELEVFATDPVQLVLAPEVEEDWGE